MALGFDHPLARLALAPVYLAQALSVRHRARMLPEAAGPRAGHRPGAGPALRLLILGDSSAAGVGAAQQDHALAGRLVAALDGFDLHWRLEARSGATTADALATAAALPAARFDVAVLALGVNDVTRQVPLTRWLARQAALQDLLRARFGIRHAYLSGVPPMGDFPVLPWPLRAMLGARAARFDAALAGFAAGQPGLRHLRFDPDLLRPEMMAEDGFHPGPAIYQHWATALAAHIRADFAPR